MATTGPKLQVSHIVNTSGATVGQGTEPELWTLYSTDDASVSTPTWNDATPRVRAFSTSRGRENELAEIDAGTATINLDNRTRTFDPVANALIRPMNRWWIREQFTGETQDIFRGYADSYDQTWPAGGGIDAVAVVHCTDEFKVLALDHLPTMNPPRDSYEALVMSDSPAGYWKFSDVNLAGTVGQSWQPTSAGSYAVANETPIVGDYIAAEIDEGGCLSMSSGFEIVTAPEAFDTQGAGEVTVEFWYKFSALPAATRIFFEGATRAAGPVRIFNFDLTSAGAVRFNANNATPTLHTATSAALAANTWWHVAGVIGGGNIRIYINGVQSGSTAWTGVLAGAGDLDTTLPPRIVGSTDVEHRLDEVAFYPARDLSTRLPAHYTAGVARGFANALPGIRAHAVLDSIDSHAPRSVQAGTRTMLAAFMHGQDPLGELRKSQKADAVNAVLFAARDGTVTFLADGHRSSSPWNTVQATFDDDGTDLPYQDLDIDFSEAFLANEWNVTRTGGTLQTASDATSIAKYFKRPQSLTDLSVTTNAHASAIATAMLAKYKDPFTRIQRITLVTAEPDVAEAVFRRDIGDKIRILSTPPGGGTRIDQSVWIQKIDVNGTPNGPWQITWAVSPL